MSKFKVGDRVAVYSSLGRRMGFIKEINKEAGIFLVFFPGPGRNDRTWAHPKQCRKLRPKAKRRRVWIADTYVGDEQITSNHITFDAEKYDIPSRSSTWVEFVEVRRRK